MPIKAPLHRNILELIGTIWVPKENKIKIESANQNACKQNIIDLNRSIYQLVNLGVSQAHFNKF